jgi:hypothetical protein
MKSQSFNEFAGDTLLQMLGTIFAINIGALPILFYEINKVEKELGEVGCFKSVKNEVKQNAIVMTSLLITAIAIGVVKDLMVLWAEYALSSVVLGVVFLAIIMLYDTVSGILTLDSVVNEQ